MYKILKTKYFQLWFLFKSNLRFSTAEKHEVIIKIKHFKTKKDIPPCWLDKGV